MLSCKFCLLKFLFQSFCVCIGPGLCSKNIVFVGRFQKSLTVTCWWNVPGTWLTRGENSLSQQLDWYYDKRMVRTVESNMEETLGFAGSVCPHDNTRAHDCLSGWSGESWWEVKSDNSMFKPRFLVKAMSVLFVCSFLKYKKNTAVLSAEFLFLAPWKMISEHFIGLLFTQAEGVQGFVSVIKCPLQQYWLRWWWMKIFPLS